MSTQHTTACTDTTVHLNGIQYPGTIARCSCGWTTKWSVRDGSAEADAADHEAKYNKRQGEDITLKVIDEGQPGIPEPDPDILEAIITNEALRAANGERIVLARVIRRAIIDYLALTTGATQP